MVYVLNNDGQPLMPTERHGKVRRLLKSGKAKVVKKYPFTIQLLYESTNYTQFKNCNDEENKYIKLLATKKEKVRKTKHKKKRYLKTKINNRKNQDL